MRLENTRVTDMWTLEAVNVPSIYVVARASNLESSMQNKPYSALGRLTHTRTPEIDTTDQKLDTEDFRQRGFYWDLRKRWLRGEILV